MVFVGIVLAAAAVGVSIAIIAENSTATSLSVFGQHIPGVSSQAHVFILGAIVAVFFVVGMMVAVFSLGRSVRVRRELRDLREEHRESLTTMEMEKRRLERELARARRDGDMPGTPDRPSAGHSTAASAPHAPREHLRRDPMTAFFEQG